jgi:high potential iron-sulfur protein
MDISRKDGAKVNGLLDKKISRRTLLKGALGITGVALASAFTVQAQAKATKAAMKYQDKPKGDQKCIDCKFFVPGKTSTDNGTCQVVEGSISPQGWCTAYTKKS